MQSLTHALLAGLLLIPLSSLPSFQTQKPTSVSREVLTNEKVIELVKLGFGDDLIIAKIRQSERRFDTSLEGLKQLKANRVSDRVIQEMLPGGGAAISPAPSVSSPPDDLRKPPQIIIQHPLSTVREAIKQELLKETGTRLISEQPQQLVFRRKATGAQNYFSSMIRGGMKLEHQITFTLEPHASGRDITVIADTTNMVLKPEGQEELAGSPNQNKTYRPTILQLLDSLKTRIESLPLPSQPEPVVRTDPTLQSISAPSNESQEFILPLNGTKQGFIYKPRSVTYQGKALAFAQRLDPKEFPTLKISLLKNLTYAAIIAENPDGVLGYVLNIASFQMIPIQKRERLNAERIKTLWSPSLHYVLFHCSYEGEYFISVNLQTGQATKPVFLLGANRRWTTRGSMQWLPLGDVLTFKAEEFCDFNADAACSGNKMNQVLAVRDVYVEAETAKPSLQNPIALFKLNTFSLQELQKLGIDNEGCSSAYAGDAQGYRAKQYFFWAKWGQTNQPDSAWIKLGEKLIRLQKAGASQELWVGGGVEVQINTKKVQAGEIESGYYRGSITVQKLNSNYRYGRQIEGKSGC